MPFYQYLAVDATGKEREGTIRAGTPDEALAALRQSGFRVTRLDGRAVGPAPVGPTRPAPQRPIASPPVAAQRAPVLNPTPAKPVPATVRTIVGTDRDRFFLFSQLAAAMRAGLNPALAFDQISNRSPSYYRNSLKDLSAAATEGVDLGAVMERYPDLYPEHVVGMTRAAQQGGYLAEAWEDVSKQAETAHKFKRWFFWVWFVFVNALISIPGMIWAMDSLVRAWERIDASGGQGDAFAEVRRAYLEKLLWPNGPIFLGICAVLYVLYRYFGSRVAKRFRHRMGLKAPVYGKRARHENLARFSWSLSKLSRAGFAPANAYQLAADTVPNLEMRDMLRQVAGRVSGAEKMSDILGNSRLFPEEYVPIVATAEYTGDLSGAFDQLARSSEAEFQSAQTYAKARSGCWGALGCFVTSAAMLGILWYTWYHVLPKKILDGMDP